MSTKAIVLTSAFSLLGAFLILMITRLWDYIWQPFFVARNMERLRNRVGDLSFQYDNVKEHVTSAGWELNSMQEEVTSVESDQQMIQVITSDEEQEQASMQEEQQQASMQEEEQTSIKEVKRRFKMVESIQREVESIDKEVSDWRMKYGVVCRSCKRPFLGFKVFMKIKEVSELLDQGYLKDIATKLPPPPAQKLPSTLNVRAMDPNLEQTLRYLQEDGVNIVGIWGMGGVGKTFLLRQINNHFTRNQHSSFHRVIFVVASRGVTPDELQKKILDQLQIQPKTGGDIESRGSSLLRFKKVLLLLDDLWKHLDLVHLGISLGEGACKVILTTRDKAVCRSMEVQRELKVECLNTEEAWNLFQKNVGENVIKSDPNIYRLAKEVVKECCGLPLALKIIGRTMSSKETWQEWQNALTLLQSSRHNEILDITDEDLFKKLEFSYVNLQTDTMKKCFLTCSMWPEDCDIFEDDLIISWMGLGLIDDYTEINEAFDTGHSIIQSLIRACLLERADDFEGSPQVKMHDVLRDMAVWIASDYGQNKNKWIVEASARLKEWKTEKWKGAHRISLMETNIESLPKRLPKCSELSVLILKFNSSLINIPRRLLRCFKSLTYLDLEGCSINELPTTVGQLVKLKFLNLRYTNVEYLPPELANLMDLKYLFLGYTSLEVIPWELISRLPMLKVLDLSGAAKMESQGAFEALKRLDGQLVGFSISIYTALALEQLLKFTTISILDLEINNLEGIESLELLSPVLFNSKATTNSLKTLDLLNCSNLKWLIVDSLHSQGIARPKTLQRLEHLGLYSLALLEKIVWRGVTPQEFLPSLHSLTISKCRKLKDVSWVLQLPNLKELHVAQCDELEMVIEDVGDGGSTFPKLRALHLQSLGNLGSICSTTIRFPSLESIVVLNCPELKKLPFQALNITDKFEVIRGSGKWWENLDWEDGNNTKSFLQNYFKADEFEVPEAKMVDSAIQGDLQECGVWQWTSSSEDADLCGPSGASKCG